MDIDPYITRLQRELALAAAAGGPEAQELAERLTGTLESGVRLAMLELLTAAAGEISLDLDDAVVEVRLRGLDPDLVVTHTDRAVAAGPEQAAAAEPDTGGTARFSLRLPDRLKPRLDEAAERAGISVNAWLVRTISAALDGGASRPAPRDGRGGWVR